MPLLTLVAAIVGTLLDPAPWRLVHWWLIAVPTGTAIWVLAGEPGHRLWGGRRRWRMRRRLAADRDLAWLAWHWVTGGPLEPRAAVPEIDDARPTRARAARRAALGAARTVLAAAVVAGEYVRSGAPAGGGPVVAVVGLAGAAVVAAGTVGIVHVGMRVAHWLMWERPLHYAVHKQACWPEDTRPHRYIKVPRDRSGDSTRITVGVHKTFPLIPAAKKRVEEIVRAKLALGGTWSAVWVEEGKRSHLRLTRKKKMPERAPFTDPAVRGLVERAKASAPIMGITKGHEPVAVDLDSEAPHVLISAGTGGGKSTMIRALTAQLMWHGARVVVIDAKRHSHGWLRPLPGVTYARDIGEIHRTLVGLAEEGHRRNRSLDDVDEDQAPEFGRLVVVCEELNATMGMLKMWWRDQRGSGDPVTSPAITALGHLLFMGRAVRIHVLAVAQLATAKDLGGPEMRENFAVRVMARYTANAAKMLVPECNLPATSRHPGRAQVCIGGLHWETQVLWMTDAEAQAWVADKRGRRPVVDVASVATDDTPVSQGKQPATVATTPQDGDGGLTLLEASRDRGRGVVALRHDALRQAARRDPEFPSPTGRRGQARLYSPAALQRWEANRPRTAGADTGAEDGVDRTDGVRPMEATREV